MQSQAPRSIVHFDLDSFFVSVERLMNTALEGKPVLVGGTSSRGVVASCSYEARKFGVHSGMPMRMARHLCPDAVLIRGDSGRYSYYSQMVTEIIREEVPSFEKTSIDEFYADLSGMDRFYGSYELATRLRNKIIRETGLPISFGMSVNKTVSKVATGEAKPNNQMCIDFGQERNFLSPLPVIRIPMIGQKTARLLARMGVRKIGTLQKMPVELMEKAMGKSGRMIWKKANGIDDSPVEPYNERKSISMERTFERDTTDVQKLEALLIAMAGSLAYQLRQGKKLTACVTLKLRYADFNTYTLQKQIPYTASDHKLIEVARELFKKHYKKRLLVRLIGLRCSHLVQGAQQISLFDDSEEMMQLYKAMDRIHRKYGSKAICRAVSMESRAGNYYNPFDGSPPVIPAHRRQ